MKTYTAKGGTRFTFHPDFSGNIVVAYSANGSALEVKAKDLDEFFVTQWLRPRLEGSIDDTIRALSDAIKTHTEPPPVPPRPEVDDSECIMCGAKGEARDDMYLILSLKHSPVWGEMANWWGPNSSGYTPDLKDAGRYTAEQVTEEPHLDDGVDTMAIPERAVINGSRRMVLWAGMSKWKAMRGEV